MKLGKEDLRFALWKTFRADANELEIEGYVRADHFADAEKMLWTKFDPNDPKTFPKDDESVLVYYDGEIVWLEAHVCDGYCTFFSPEWNPKMKHITHWRPLPKPPQETEERK